ncbi:MAG: hypothetical protein ACK5MT_14885 [Actinomycetales bacterium]
MSNTSNLQKTGLQMLLGRDRFEMLMEEADRVGLSMATVVRRAIDEWMNQPAGERRYDGEIRRGRVIDVSGKERVHPRPFG